MADEIYLARLDDIVTDLGNSITEFRDASEIAKDISGAVGTPMGKNGLKGQVADFENDWNDTRDKLLENLEGVNQHLKDIRDGFEEWDLEAKKAFLNSRAADAPKASK